MFVKKIGLLTAIVAALLPALAKAQEADTALRRIQQNRAVTIGFRESAQPFAYLNENRQASGYSIDVCKRIAQEIGGKLNIPDIAIRYVPVTPQTRIPLIANGTVDIECGTTVNSLARQEQVDFSYAVALAEGRPLVKKTSGIQDLPDLNGKIVALAAGTTAERYVRAALDRSKINVRVLQVRDNAEGLLAVASQRADAFVNDAVLLGGALRTAQNKDDFAVVGEPLSFEQVAFMVGKNNSGLLTIINGTIARLLASGDLQKLYDQWIAPYGVPIEGEVGTLFKIEAIAE
ncbi:amino acid ABC transporter substrate-binding protein [Bradyrhizobium sp.]|uniref:amino acid ABC transporter substrate-binding protein n=1 Tax=Bradyrhizobium sp. TaxID=376 RepID=UPI001ED26BD5|nr:amino acid ABC transporter substrate-binding protein [Bradyrhizobium sp.]MBV8922166.1 amino acid ABC transporter substrate-binding protein [Bradyrhizobium sp.]MBV9978614.1 amino acid ABC transporter substrate-binding protein [Bradyrhizobium sp.]